MGGEDRQRRRSTAVRLLLVQAEGCPLCISLDVVEGVVARGTLRERPIDILDWSDVAGAGWSDVAGTGTKPSPSPEDPVVLVRTEAAPLGLVVQSCLGVREVSFLQTPPIPTRLVDETGRSLCHLLLLDGQPNFLVEPQALTQARTQSPLPNALPRKTDESAQPAPAVEN